MRTFAIIALLFLTAAPLLCHAQDDDKDKRKEHGLRLGYDLSDLVGGEENMDLRPGFYGGFYTDVIKVPIYSLSVGLEFNTAGAIGKDLEQDLSYLNLPINNRIRLGLFYLDGGFDVGYKLHEKRLFDGSSMDIPSGEKADPWNVMAHVGGGIKLLFLGIEGRYQYGLTEPYSGVRNTSIQIGISTFF